MAKLNLAPEVYQNSQRNRQRKRLATSIGVAVSVVSLAILGVGLLILGGQQVYLITLGNDIHSRQDQVKTYADLPEAATSQQHLASVGQLQSNKVYLSRFFAVLQTIAPQGIAASSVAIDEQNTLTLSGTAKSYDLVTKFAKALEADNVQIGKQASPTNEPHFSNVQLSSVSGTQGGIEFKLTTQMASEVTSGN